MPVAAVGDIEMYYEEHGTGHPVLLINGTGADLRQNPLRGQGLLEQNFKVLMFDQRGLGQTSKPDYAYTMADYADDAAGLLDAVGWESCHVVGISFGGMVAQQLALRHPDRVEKLVLVCTSSGGAGGSSFDLLSIDELPTEERLRRWLPILDTRIDRATDPSDYPPLMAGLAQQLAQTADLQDPATKAGARRQLQARAGHDVWDQLGSIAAPTLVMGGGYDGQAPPERSQRLAEAIPHATLVMCEGGHVFLLQDPTAWPTIVEFLGGS